MAGEGCNDAQHRARMNWHAGSCRAGCRWSSALSSASSQRQKGEGVAGLLVPCVVKVASPVVCPAKADTFSGSLTNLLPTGGLGVIRMSNKPLRPDVAQCRAGMAELLTEAVAMTRHLERRLAGGRSGNRHQCRPGRDATNRRRAAASQAAGTHGHRSPGQRDQQPALARGVD